MKNPHLTLYDKKTLDNNEMNFKLGISVFCERFLLKSICTKLVRERCFQLVFSETTSLQKKYVYECNINKKMT